MCTRIISSSKTISIPSLSTVDFSFEPIESRNKPSATESLLDLSEPETVPTYLTLKMEHVSESSQFDIYDVVPINDNNVTQINHPGQFLKGTSNVEMSEMQSPKSLKNSIETKDRMVYINCLNFNFDCNEKFDGKNVEESDISLSGIPLTNSVPQRPHASDDVKPPQLTERRQQRSFNLQSFQKHLSLKTAIDPRANRARSATCLQRRCCSNDTSTAMVAHSKEFVKKDDSSVTFLSVGSSSYPLIDRQYYIETNQRQDNKRVDFTYNRSMYKQFQYNDFQNSRFNKVIHPNRSATTLCVNANYFKNQKRLRRLNIS